MYLYSLQVDLAITPAILDVAWFCWPHGWTIKWICSSRPHIGTNSVPIMFQLVTTWIVLKFRLWVIVLSLISRWKVFLRFACCCPRTFTGHYVLIVGGGWALCCSMTRICKLGCAPAPIQRKNMQPWFKKVGKYWEVAGIILLFIFEIQPLNTEPQYFSGDVTGKCDGSLKVFKTLPHAWCWLNPTQVLDQSSLEAMTERLWLPEDGMGTWGIAVHKYWKLVKLLRSWRAKIKSKKIWILIFIGLKVGLWQGEYIICIAQHLKKNIITIITIKFIQIRFTCQPTCLPTGRSSMSWSC